MRLPRRGCCVYVRVNDVCVRVYACVWYVRVCGVIRERTFAVQQAHLLEQGALPALAGAEEEQLGHLRLLAHILAYFALDLRREGAEHRGRPR